MSSTLHFWKRATLRIGLMLLLGRPAPVRAWTDTKVISALARVDAREPGRAEVELELGVRVSAGWLSHFELVDLGIELRLDPAREVRLQDAQGTTYVPRVELSGDRGLNLAFPERARAPKPGDYTLTVAWSSRLDTEGSRATWALPRWPNRIPNVRIEVLAPSGARPAASGPRAADEVLVEPRPSQRATQLSFVRTELPHTDSFAVSWVTPEPQAAEPSYRLHLRDDRRRWPWLGVVLGLGVLASAVGLVSLAGRAGVTFSWPFCAGRRPRNRGL